MGMNLGKKGSMQSEINITPLVDVVLVLLIIFMVTMPIVMKQMPLEVPKELQNDETVTAENAKFISVLVKADNSVLLNDDGTETTIPLTSLATTLRPTLDAKKGTKIVFVDFDDAVSWKDAIETMDTLRGMSQATKQDDVGNTVRDFNEVKVALKKRDLPMNR